MLDNLYLLACANFDTPNESIVMYTIVLRHEFVGQAKFMAKFRHVFVSGTEVEYLL